jgi:hypothetical protein
MIATFGASNGFMPSLYLFIHIERFTDHFVGAACCGDIDSMNPPE